ncbi:MAG TPA: YdcF family protein [Verrucomicrobiae bacterium]|jgi:uncharacterized SAM-binding protein YcdF (DUF218 family)
MKTTDDMEGGGGERKVACGGIFVRKECWRLSYKGWVLGLGLVVCFVLFLRGFIYGFLAINEPIESDCVVVEGWLTRDAMTKAAQYIQTHKIHRVFTTGVDAREVWETFSGETYADLGKEHLASLGVPKEEITAVPSHELRRDRTYNSALALREWSKQHGNSLVSFNLITEGPHARRSRLLFKRALGPKIEFGVISMDPVVDETTGWWQSSAGIREVYFECIAYSYVALFFHPPAP